MSRRKTFPSFNSSRQMMTAWKVSGLSHRPAIMASRPASMRLAMAISPSRDSSSTEPISRRYIRTGSSVRSAGSLASDLAGVFGVTSTSSPASVSSSSGSSRAFLALGLGFLGLDDVDAHLAHHRQHVFDLLGGDLLRRHHGIELLIGDVAALLGRLDHLLDGGVGEIEQRQRGVRGLGRLLLRRLSSFGAAFCGAALALLATVLVATLLLAMFLVSTTPVPTNAAPVFSSPTLWRLPTPGGRTAFRGVSRLKDPPPTAKKGQRARRRRPNRDLTCRGTPLSSD